MCLLYTEKFIHSYEYNVSHMMQIDKNIFGMRRSGVVCLVIFYNHRYAANQELHVTTIHRKIIHKINEALRYMGNQKKSFFLGQIRRNLLCNLISSLEIFLKFKLLINQTNSNL